MTTTIAYSGQLTTMSCWCGIHFAIPTELYTSLHQETTQKGYCPLGHLFGWSESDADRERKRRQQVEAQATHLRDQLEAERRQHAATKGQLTKTRKRAAAALCPVQGCGRSFVQMARHLATKHPEFTHTHEEH